MKKSFAFGLTVCAGLLAEFASAQIYHGSIGITYFTKDKVVMAADSRGSRGGKDATPNDRECKVAALGKDVIFSVTGLVSYEQNGHSDGLNSWNALVDVRSAYSKAVQGSSHGRIKNIAEAWGEFTLGHAKRIYSLNPKLARFITAPSGIIASGTFSGFDASGQLVLFQAVVKQPEPGNFSVPPIAETTQITCLQSNFCASGATEIFVEFSRMTSQRARDETKTWKPLSSNIADYGLMRAMRFVELTILHHKGDDVGGPIDALELNRDGSRSWYARKPNCPAN